MISNSVHWLLMTMRFSIRCEVGGRHSPCYHQMKACRKKEKQLASLMLRVSQQANTATALATTDIWTCMEE
jgi:hypothetical protein